MCEMISDQIIPGFQGVFLAFQYPVEIPGVTNFDFLMLAVNKRRAALGLDEYDPITFSVHGHFLDTS